MEKLKFRYVGNKPNPDRRLISTGEPVPMEVFRAGELSAFRAVFRDAVGATVRESKGLFQRSLYTDLPPQQNTFDRLEECIGYQKYEIVQVTREEHRKNEFIARVEVQVPTIDGFNDQPFKTALPEGSKAQALVSFYLGVCNEFTTIMKQNELVEKALQECVNAVAALHLEEDELEKERARRTSALFNPEKVIPELIKSMRLERRYSYVLENGKWPNRHFFQSPEGHIYRIEVDGYSLAQLS